LTNFHILARGKKTQCDKLVGAKITQLVMGLASEFKIPSELAAVGVKMTQLVMVLASELAAVGAKMTQLVMGLASEFKIPSEIAVIGVKTTQLVMGLASELAAVGAKMTQLVMGLASELAAVSGEEQASGPTHPVESMMMTMIHRHVDVNE
jgi:hypothetical protein